MNLPRLFKRNGVSRLRSTLTILLGIGLLSYPTLVRAEATDTLPHPSQNFIELTYEGGTPLKSTATMKQMMQQGYTSSVVLTWGHQYTEEDFGTITGRRYYPSVGVSVAYSNYSRVRMVPTHPGDNHPISDFGHFVAVAPSFTHYHQVDGNWRLKSVVENGVAYAFHPYNRVSNPNSSIGGHFQIYFSYGIFSCLRWGDYEVSAGPQFTHYSNSGTYRPNNGVNNVAVSLRLKRATLHDIPESDPLKPENQFQPYLFLAFNINGGFHTFKESEALYRERHPEEPYLKSPTVYGDLNLSTDLMYRPKSYMSYGVGVDFFYRGGYEVQRDYYETLQNRDALSHLQRLYLGLALKHETYIRNFAIQINVGCYLNDQHLVSLGSFTRIYERIGLRYYFNSEEWVRPYIGYYIKGNLFTAEQFEGCVGISFSRDRERPVPWRRGLARVGRMVHRLR